MALSRVDMSGVGASVAESLAGLREIDWEHTLRDTSRDSWGPSLLTGVALGAVIGGLVALFLTPSTGRDMRATAANVVRTMVSRGGDAAGQHERTLADAGADAERDVRLRNSSDF